MEYTLHGKVQTDQKIKGKIKDIPQLDDTLTKAGYAADAQASGNAIKEAKNQAVSEAKTHTDDHTKRTNNPHNVTAEQVGARANTWLPTIAEIGAAPASAIDIGVLEASGEVISVQNSGNASLHGLKIYGKTTQNGTPTPEAPVELVSVGESGAINTTVAGKNLLGGFKSKTENGVTFTVNEDGSVHVKGTSLYSTALGTKVHLLPGNYMLSGCPEGGSQAATDGNFTLYMQILSDAGNKYYFDTGRGVVLPISVEGDYAIRILLRANTTIDKTFYPMVEIGNTVTEYEPYKGQTLTTSTPNGLHGIDSVKDEIDFARGVRVQRVGEYTFTGKETLNVYGNVNANGFGRFSLGTQIQDAAFIDNSKIVPSYCNKYIATSPDELAIFINTNNGMGYKFTFITGRTVVFSTDITDSASFAAEIAGTTILYQLATPIETPLSEEELTAYAALHTNKPNTTVYNDAGAYMEMEYYSPISAVPVDMGEGAKGKALIVDENGHVVPMKMTAADVGAAPAGYGLGGESKQLTSSDDLNNIKANGWYQWSSDNKPKNIPTTPGTIYMFAMRVTVAGACCLQEVFDVSDSTLRNGCIRRVIYGSLVFEWEWENPPMTVGVEYRTTERYEGKAVYTQCVNFGALPNATVKTVEHGISGIKKMVFANAVAWVGNATMYIPGLTHYISEFQSGEKTLVIRTTADLSGWTNCVFRLKYTKD